MDVYRACANKSAIAMYLYELVSDHPRLETISLKLAGVWVGAKRWMAWGTVGF